jgi:glycerophosphoryl diester phosphodiesterase
MIIILLVILSVAVIAAWIFLNRKGEGRPIADKKGIPYLAIMAHRGVSDLAPEATDPAYRLALEMGADYLEADIQRTADGVLVCFHDDTLERNTDAAEVFPGREKDSIDKFTYAELMMLDLGTWFNRKYPDRARESFHELKILTLEELIDIAESHENRPGLYLETKSALRYPGIEKQIIDLLRSRGWIHEGKTTVAVETRNDMENDDGNQAAPVRIADGPARVILQSFEEDSIRIMKELAPDVPRIYLVDEEMEEKKGGWSELIAIAKKYDADLGPSGYQGWPWKTAEAHRNGLLVHHYTLNQPWQMRLLRFFGTDGIFTNRADLALQTYRNKKMLPVEEYFKRIGY